jgi:hypothetical protein
MTAAKPLLTLLSKKHPILDPATPLQHIFVVRIAVPFADDVRCAELELRW